MLVSEFHLHHNFTRSSVYKQEYKDQSASNALFMNKLYYRCTCS